MEKVCDLIGKKFGKLTILNEEIGVKPKSVKCVCDCGNYITVPVRNFKYTCKKRDKSCGCSSFASLIGKKFNMLTVISSVKRTNPKQPRWKCLCECGKETEVDACNLKSKIRPVKSCGCLQKNPILKNPDRELILLDRLYMHMVVSRAKRINKECTLDFETFKNLVLSPCFYCGNELSNYSAERKEFRGGKVKTYIRHNGIDRVNSNLGYTKENCVPCCKFCNSFKKDMTKENFLSKMKNIYIKTVQELCYDI